MVILQGCQLHQPEGLSAVRMGSAQLLYVLVKRKDHTTAPENFISNRSGILVILIHKENNKHRVHVCDLSTHQFFNQGVLAPKSF
jgi:hypothetical protein